MIDRGPGDIPLSVVRRLPKWAFAIESDTTGQVSADLRPLLLRRDAAAAVLSMSVDSFERYVEPELKIVIRGRLKLVPYFELERWVRENAATVSGTL